MKVAMVSTPFISVPPSAYGGTELIVYELVEGLTARGHEVTLFAPFDSRTTGELRSLYEHACWPPDPMHDLNHVSWALHEVRHGSFDLIHAHSAAALAVSRFVPDVPLVYTIHHVRDETLSSYYRFFPGVRYVAISADQARREIPLPMVDVIHHGLDASVYDWREQSADYVCFVGRLSEVKGPHVAIDVAERADVPIRVAGEIHDADVEFGEREVTPRLSRPHVTFLGPIGIDGKAPLLRDARAMLMPISWNEPFGLVMIEAMLSGCPVVAFPRGSVPELVEDGVTGFIVGSPEEMTEVIRAGGRADGFDRRRCRERAVERFSRDRMVEQHELLYRRLVRGPEAVGAGRGSSADAA